ncbi:hypothetical protein C1Y63_04550 [Corynebacterium sp. 13CS0277]|uniref:hypothetical protein n=1 Tax=Corynebacterium sp. 13CS0277 TaxID=2071994 RepID=UPI000D044904|nr:hypothetical protein [Corynebacterium sp. 13CS0277]PRQ11684.1 hypothetical protein C1Y63_04550 [Corynebacterium sp. 13CS0277]
MENNEDLQSTPSTQPTDQPSPEEARALLADVEHTTAHTRTRVAGLNRWLLSPLGAATTAVAGAATAAIMIYASQALLIAFIGVCVVAAVVPAVLLSRGGTRAASRSPLPGTPEEAATRMRPAEMWTMAAFFLSLALTNTVRMQEGSTKHIAAVILALVCGAATAGYMRASIARTYPVEEATR